MCDQVFARYSLFYFNVCGIFHSLFVLAAVSLVCKAVEATIHFVHINFRICIEQFLINICPCALCWNATCTANKPDVDWILCNKMNGSGFGRAVLRSHNRGGPRAPDPDDALGRRGGGGAADLSPVSAGTALLALELQVRQALRFGPI